MAKLNDRLDALLSREISAQRGTSSSNVNAERTIRRLLKRDITTVRDLIERLPALPYRLQNDGIDLISRFDIRQATPVLLEILPKKAIRLAVSSALSFLPETRRVIRTFIEAGQRELASNCPDFRWLWAAVLGLGNADDPQATEVLLTIFERQDLPGWLRGDAGDKLGCHETIHDQRSILHRRSLAAAILGISEESIEVQFWSLYLIGSLASNKRIGDRTRKQLRSALPRIREIAASDHRFAPGYWWPMSAEAEDIVHCIRYGTWKNPDASERWLGSGQHGPMEPRNLD